MHNTFGFLHVSVTKSVPVGNDMLRNNFSLERNRMLAEKANHIVSGK